MNRSEVGILFFGLQIQADEHGMSYLLAGLVVAIYKI